MEEYKEHIYIHHQTGPGYYSDFTFILKSNDDFVFNIEIDSDRDNFETVEKGVLYGIRDIQNEFMNKGIGFEGIDIQIINHSFHVIDSKPAGFEYPLIYAFRRLVATDCFFKNVRVFEDKNNLFEINKINSEGLLDLKGHQNFIFLPKKFESTLYLKESWQSRFILSSFKQELYSEDFKKVELRIHPNLYSRKSLNGLSIQFAKRFEASFEYLIMEEFRNFKNTIYKRGINLGSHSIIVDSEVKDCFAEFNPMGWALETLFYKKENYEMFRENSKLI